ncbi:hypothetical protein LCGC14_1991180 [marine sediment metagenome]|uniref:Uncharacterized protein n=1 Tax=marine sediment metagenome TaxID=412755 RepID=A0A0F9HJE7_9ZZZZ
MNDTEFNVNKYLFLRLEGKLTLIYVNRKRYTHCTRVILNIPIEDIEKYDGIESIDEICDLNNHFLIENKIYKEENGELNPSLLLYDISPEAEFWAHCSNIQAWVEHDYDTCILHSNLAFPLLKELTKAGDPQAKRVFKEEIAKRIGSGYFTTIKYLILEGYLFYLTDEELLCALDICKEKLAYPHYIKLIYEIMENWEDDTFSLEDKNKRILKWERMTKFFSRLMTDTKIRRCFENFINGFYERPNDRLLSIIHSYYSACRQLCDYYSEAGMYDKLQQHCILILSQDSKSSYPWKYLGVAYRKKDLFSYARAAENIYKVKERLRRKKLKKKLRKHRRKVFFWRYFFRYFSHRYWCIRKYYHNLVLEKPNG